MSIKLITTITSNTTSTEYYHPIIILVDLLMTWEFFGSISLILWSISSLPQLYTNWYHKSVDSISLPYLVLGSIGSLLNLIGSLNQGGLIPTTVGLGTIQLVSNLLLLSQVIYYKFGRSDYDDSNNNNNNKKKKKCLVVNERSSLHYPLPCTRTSSVYSTFSSTSTLSDEIEDDTSDSGLTIFIKATLALFLFIIPFCTMLASFEPPHHLDLSNSNSNYVYSDIPLIWYAAILGWIATFLLSTARIPQIWYNQCRRSTHQLSITTLLLTSLGNLTFIISLLIYSQEFQFLIVNLPWLMGSLLPSLFDFMIIGQIYYYRTSSSPSPLTTTTYVPV